MEFAWIRPDLTNIWKSRIRQNSTQIRLNLTCQKVAGLGKKDGNFLVSNAMWNRFKSHSTAKMAKGRTMSKRLRIRVLCKWSVWLTVYVECDMWGIAFDIEIRIRHMTTPRIQQEISRMRFSTLCKWENHYVNDKLQTPSHSTMLRWKFLGSRGTSSAFDNFRKCNSTYFGGKTNLVFELPNSGQTSNANFS